jgi:hypothetical protein
MIYAKRFNDEHGLILAGWSGDWDHALRAAMLRAPNRRYSTFWTTRGAPGSGAQELIAHRKARQITIADADGFFRNLAQRITILAKTRKQSPLSIDLLVSSQAGISDSARRGCRPRGGKTCSTVGYPTFCEQSAVAPTGGDQRTADFTARTIAGRRRRGKSKWRYSICRRANVGGPVHRSDDGHRQVHKRRKAGQSCRCGSCFRCAHLSFAPARPQALKQTPAPAAISPRPAQ